MACGTRRAGWHRTSGWSHTPNASDAPIISRTDRKSTRLNSSHTVISYAVFCLKKKKKTNHTEERTTLCNSPTRQKTFAARRTARPVFVKRAGIEVREAAADSQPRDVARGSGGR